MALVLGGCAGTGSDLRDAGRAHSDARSIPASSHPAANETVRLPASISQAGMVIGHAPPGSTVRYAGRTLWLGPDGAFVFGVARDASGAAQVQIVTPDGRSQTVEIRIVPHPWKIERVNGVPEGTVHPSPEIAARIEREQASVALARERDDPREDFLVDFIAPVNGRISGWFGSQRIYNGTPGAAHSGLDIAAPKGTPVQAPAAGIVIFAAPDLYLTGGTVVIDHGCGISSNFLHLSRIDVKVGDRVEQGQVFAAVGATGRATGPHMHWGVNWFETRLDPELLLEHSAHR